MISIFPTDLRKMGVSSRISVKLTRMADLGKRYFG